MYNGEGWDWWESLGLTRKTGSFNKRYLCNMV